MLCQIRNSKSNFANDKMKKISIKHCLDHPEDCRKIQKILRDNGYAISLVDADLLWRYYSSTYSRSWIRVDDDDILINDLLDSLKLDCVVIENIWLIKHIIVMSKEQDPLTNGQMHVQLYYNTLFNRILRLWARGWWLPYSQISLQFCYKISYK